MSSRGMIFNRIFGFHVRHEFLIFFSSPVCLCAVVVDYLVGGRKPFA